MGMSFIIFGWQENDSNNEWKMNENRKIEPRAKVKKAINQQQHINEMWIPQKKRAAFITNWIDRYFTESI